MATGLSVHRSNGSASTGKDIRVTYANGSYVDILSAGRAGVRVSYANGRYEDIYWNERIIAPHSFDVYCTLGESSETLLYWAPPGLGTSSPVVAFQMWIEEIDDRCFYPYRLDSTGWGNFVLSVSTRVQDKGLSSSAAWCTVAISSSSTDDFFDTAVLIGLITTADGITYTVGGRAHLYEHGHLFPW